MSLNHVQNIFEATLTHYLEMVMVMHGAAFNSANTCGKERVFMGMRIVVKTPLNQEKIILLETKANPQPGEKESTLGLVFSGKESLMFLQFLFGVAESWRDFYF